MNKVALKQCNIVVLYYIRTEPEMQSLHLLAATIEQWEDRNVPITADLRDINSAV